MATRFNSQKTIEILHKYDFVLKKKYGQNFLCDARVPERIAEAAMIEKSDHIIEIGPGIGTLTQLLCEKAGSVTAVEIDKSLIPILEETLSDYDNVKILNADIMKLDLESYIRDEVGEEDVSVVANLPYYITTPIILMLLEKKLPLKRITVMVQAEVAERMKAGPGTKDYGALSLAVQYHSDPKIVFNVPPHCFIPRPEVTSSVITMEILRDKKIPVKNEDHMFKLIRAAFNQRRKTLANALGNDPGLSLDKKKVTEALCSMGLNENIRGEALTLQEFAMLSDLLS
ncbi:MAG: 16S rRNA (adenine(1518)-N(6)/adenine(1519)-N(6))-dimethyltransferase RsmA [Lachnospiraceae bacterium]|nr:16S rRNA (adenine(1518)-N(6)/adenine(1519)-N(6))-dimethyltransferase RsmA [Lachnospiraceae bacterium]